MPRILAVAASLAFGTLAAAQSLAGSVDNHPPIKTYKCSKAFGCRPQQSYIVLDAASHWVHQKDDQSQGCGNWGSPPNATVCPDEATCAKNCVMHGISDYSTNGVTTSGESLTLDMLREDLSVMSPRVYLLNARKDRYEMMNLLNGEFTFDVDMSKLPCGMNSALYLSEMSPTGAKSPLNPGGAAFGTGYCDAQCFTTPFINGVGNVKGQGACCNEFDIWEANKRATHIAPHPCNITGLYKCTGDECGDDGVCDKDGCPFNPYRVGQYDYYGPGMKVDTNRPFTVVTQFPTNRLGELYEIRRLYIQDRKIIYNSPVLIPEGLRTNAMTTPLCDAVGSDAFKRLGGHKEMGEAIGRGMVLAMSIWWDEGGYMRWLDSGEAGPCSETEGAPANIRLVQPDTSVTFSKLKWGEMGSTFSTWPGPPKGKPKPKPRH